MDMPVEGFRERLGAVPSKSRVLRNPALDDIEGARIASSPIQLFNEAEDLTGSDIGISESISVITNIKHSPAITPTRRSRPGLIESGGPRLWTMLITNASIACVPT